MHYPGRKKAGLDGFYERYGAILQAAANRVQQQAERYPKTPHTSIVAVASWIAKDLPDLYRRTFGTENVLPLKEWRVRTMLSNAAYLGAFTALGIVAIHGRGLTPADPPTSGGGLKERSFRTCV